ncbi:unnamed protein product [Mytilus coruscus]|uniref:WSC domain-containing protein n=1 Tax=Mytilus coruscus TaxID=42192 RepID=A0A6J8ELB0_MYTCO|nr:unnamed protein product [Mytilus coruscus]
MLVIQFINSRNLFYFLNWIFFKIQIVISTEVEYLGCYVDDLSRMLDNRHGDILTQMTLEWCKQKCYKHQYLGLQASTQCFCGNSLGDQDVYQKTNDSECNRPCRGNSLQICGGYWRNSVYEFITATVPATEMTTQGHSTLRTTEMTTPGHFTVKTTEMTTPGKSTVTTTEMTTPGHFTVKTTEMTTPGQSKVTTTGQSTFGQSEVITTEMTTPGHSTVITTDMTNNRKSVTTAELITLGQSKVTTTDMTTPGKSSVTTLQITKPGASEVTTMNTTPILVKSQVTSVEPIIPLECLCPCSKVGKGKWDFLRGMNLALDQIREILKPELDLMKKELSINKSNTSRMRRSKISAPDDRVSATSVGYVGVIFICLITVLIVLIDILGCIVAKFKRRS